MRYLTFAKLYGQQRGSEEKGLACDIFKHSALVSQERTGIHSV